MQQLSLVRAKIRRRRIKIQPPSFYEGMAYVILALNVFDVVTHEAQHPSSWYPCMGVITQVCIFVFFVVIELLIGRFRSGKTPSVWEAMRITWHNIYWLPFFSFYVGAFIVTLALHFPFVVQWWWQ